MDIALTNEDVDKVKKLFPQLNCEVRSNRIWGTLGFCCWYDDISKELEHDSQHREAICDSYEIEIEFDKKTPSVFQKSMKPPEKFCDFQLTRKWNWKIFMLTRMIATVAAWGYFLSTDGKV